MKEVGCSDVDSASRWHIVLSDPDIPALTRGHRWKKFSRDFPNIPQIWAQIPDFFQVHFGKFPNFPVNFQSFAILCIRTKFLCNITCPHFPGIFSNFEYCYEFWSKKRAETKLSGSYFFPTVVGEAPFFPPWMFRDVRRISTFFPLWVFRDVRRISTFFPLWVSVICKEYPFWSIWWQQKCSALNLFIMGAISLYNPFQSSTGLQGNSQILHNYTLQGWTSWLAGGIMENHNRNRSRNRNKTTKIQAHWSFTIKSNWHCLVGIAVFFLMREAILMESTIDGPANQFEKCCIGQRENQISAKEKCCFRLLESIVPQICFRQKRQKRRPVSAVLCW